MAEDKSIREQAEEIRNGLDDLIGNEDHIDVSQDQGEFLQRSRPKEATDYKTLKNKSTDQAKKTITSLMKFYLDADIIEEDEYIQAKKKMDEMTMSSLIYQLNAGEMALTTLLETIDGGELAPRMFEVLATLQKSMLDIIKSQTMYLMAAEEATKRIARDIELYSKKENKKEIEGSSSSGDGLTQRGTKDLMAAIQASMHKGDIEDIEPEEE